MLSDATLNRVSGDYRRGYRDGHANSDPFELIADWFVDDILSMSDEEVLAECREDGEDPAEGAGAMTRIFEAARAQCRGE